MTFLDRFEQRMNWIKDVHDKNDDRFELQEEILRNTITQTEVWKASIKEQLDGLEDHMKEIKKTLLFK